MSRPERRAGGSETVGDRKQWTRSARRRATLSVEPSVRQDDLLRSIVLDATRLIGAECGVVYLWHPETGTLQPPEGIHVGPTEHRHLPLRPDQGVTRRAFSQRRVQLVNDYPNDFHARPNALDCQVRALIAAPLLTHASWS